MRTGACIIILGMEVIALALAVYATTHHQPPDVTDVHNLKDRHHD